jgi:hypothetical protein
MADPLMQKRKGNRGHDFLRASHLISQISPEQHESYDGYYLRGMQKALRCLAMDALPLHERNGYVNGILTVT